MVVVVVFVWNHVNTKIGLSIFAVDTISIKKVHETLKQLEAQ